MHTDYTVKVINYLTVNGLSFKQGTKAPKLGHSQIRQEYLKTWASPAGMEKKMTSYINHPNKQASKQILFKVM